MKDWPILFKGVMGGLAFGVLHLLTIPALYTFDLSIHTAMLLGGICGVILSLISYSDTAKKMILTLLACILSVICVQFIFWFTGIPYRIIWYTFRNDEIIQALGHLEVFELISYNFGFLFFFIPGLLGALVISSGFVLVRLCLRKRHGGSFKHKTDLLSQSLTTKTTEIINLLFDPADIDAINTALVDECGTNLPFCDEQNPAQLERLRFAVLKISNGNMDRFREAVDLANSDWRDLLMAADFGNDIYAHNAWANSTIMAHTLSNESIQKGPRMHQQPLPEDTDFARLCDQILYYMWDPIGVSGDAPVDEYRSYLPKVLQFARQRDETGLADYLKYVMTALMGMSHQSTGIDAVVELIMNAQLWMDNTITLSPKSSWHELGDEKAIAKFLKGIYGFHDSCIKEMRYVSGACVYEDLSMAPFNDLRSLRMIVQRQFPDPSVIEIEFAGLKRLSMVPVTEEFTCEIHGASMFLDDGLIIWCDDDSFSSSDLKNFDATLENSKHAPYNNNDAHLDGRGLTLVVAEKARWREANEYIGSALTYRSQDTPEEEMRGHTKGADRPKRSAASHPDFENHE
jgi:hypothetical protein